MLCNKLHVFPVIMALYLPFTFIITYAIAVYNDHVEPVFPYISDTGTIPPESCIFGQLLNLYAALTAWCMYLRYKQVRLYYRGVELAGIEPGSHRSRSVRKKQLANKACLVIGIIASLGASVVGNFQEDNVLSVHLLGAAMAFGGGGVYIWMQALLSYKMANLPRSHRCTRHVRVVLAIIHSICFFIMMIATKLSLDKFPYSLKRIKLWKSSDPGYTEHLFATFTEWIMAVVLSAYFLTYFGELKVVRTKMLIMHKNATLVANSNSVVPNRSPTLSTNAAMAYATAVYTDNSLDPVEAADDNKQVSVAIDG
ncbi:DNA damage-regulated autophagy modulator protein 2-like [Littorina saxatilis]|uniref:CWH43-like N-terminal domain-containing protein n=1 Tax=Littorina saxatilis TaxID=31220 RepID=A0AAN9G8J8_9CAEN